METDMKERLLTCIVCPKGCPMTVTLSDDGKVLEVKGNTCPRGKVYADSECTHPVRTVTSTVFTEDGGIVSVKTSAAIPKELVFRVMDEINSIRAPKTTSIGDVIIKNVLDTGADVVASSNVNR